MSEREKIEEVIMIGERPITINVSLGTNQAETYAEHRDKIIEVFINDFTPAHAALCAINSEGMLDPNGIFKDAVNIVVDAYGVKRPVLTAYVEQGLLDKITALAKANKVSRTRFVGLFLNAMDSHGLLTHEQVATLLAE